MYGVKINIEQSLMMACADAEFKNVTHDGTLYLRIFADALASWWI